MYYNLGMVCGTTKRLISGQASTKEAHMWDLSDGQWKQYAGSSPQTTYQALYDNSTCNHFMDATPNYLYTPISSIRMASYMNVDWQKAVRMLVVVRA